MTSVWVERRPVAHAQWCTEWRTLGQALTTGGVHRLTILVEPPLYDTRLKTYTDKLITHRARSGGKEVSV